jgi:hypothetical protein
MKAFEKFLASRDIKKDSDREIIAEIAWDAAIAACIAQLNDGYRYEAALAIMPLRTWEDEE